MELSHSTPNKRLSTPIKSKSLQPKASILLTAALLAASLSTPSHAGFGDFLKKIESEGKAAIEEKLGTPDESTTQLASSLSTDTIINGLYEALKVGAKRSITTLSQENGYLGNNEVKIPLPDNIEKVSGLLRKYGLGSQLDAFESSMNRAAEKAIPQATDIVVGAISDMTFNDAVAVYQGGDNAATRYFKDKTSGQLTDMMSPLVHESMESVGVTRYYNQLITEAKKVPYINKVLGDASLESHVTQGAVDGLFTLLAKEEAQIRENPSARTSDILKTVFGN